MAVKTVKVDLPAEIFDVAVNVPLIHQVVVAQQAAALRGALSDRARNDRVHVVDALVSGDKPYTKAALAALTSLTDRVGYLVVLERTDAITWLSLRNAPEVHIVAVDQLNTYDVLNADDVVFTKGAYDAFVNGTSVAGASTAKSESAAPVATEQATDEPALPAGAKAPLKSGKNPKGYEVQGLQSGTYLVEGDAGYDVSGGDFWFKSAEDAETAGLTRADAKESDK